MLSYYRVGDKKTPAGVLLAMLDQKKNQVVFGWSKVGIAKNGTLKDNFDKSRGQFIALKRAENSGLKNVPVEMKAFVESFMGEAKNYFKPPKLVDTVTFKEPNKINSHQPLPAAAV